VPSVKPETQEKNSEDNSKLPKVKTEENNSHKRKAASVTSVADDSATLASKAASAKESYLARKQEKKIKIES